MKVLFDCASGNSMADELDQLRAYGLDAHRGKRCSEIIIDEFHEFDLWRLIDVANGEDLIIKDCRLNIALDYDLIVTIYDGYVE